MEKDLWRSPLLRPLCELENIIDPSAGSEASMFFTFPEDAHWNADRQAVEFGVEIASTRCRPGPAARVPASTSRAADPGAVRRGY